MHVVAIEKLKMALEGIWPFNLEALESFSANNLKLNIDKTTKIKFTLKNLKA